MYSNSDLSLEACHAFWQSFNDKKVYDVILLLESIEDWAIDNEDEIDSALVSLGNDLDSLSSLKIENETFDELLSFCVYLRMSRKLRFMYIIDSLDPGSASRLIQYAEKNAPSSDTAALFLKRNLIFERMRILARVFDKDRVDMIKGILDKSIQGSV